MKGFLENNNLPTNLVDNNWTWEDFADAYTSIISDQPIELSVKTGTMVLLAVKDGHTIRFNAEIKLRPSSK